VDHEQPDRDSHDRSVPVQRRDVERSMVDVPVAGSHGGPEARPVALAIIGRDDKIQRLADRVRSAVAEECLGPGIPDADDTGWVREKRALVLLG
jgi:hypothetical protein